MGCNQSALDDSMKDSVSEWRNVFTKAFVSLQINNHDPNGDDPDPTKLRIELFRAMETQKTKRKARIKKCKTAIARYVEKYAVWLDYNYPRLKSISKILVMENMPETDLLVSPGISEATDFVHKGSPLQAFETLVRLQYAQNPEDKENYKYDNDVRVGKKAQSLKQCLKDAFDENPSISQDETTGEIENILDQIAQLLIDNTKWHTKTNPYYTIRKQIGALDPKRFLTRRRLFKSNPPARRHCAQTLLLFAALLILLFLIVRFLRNGSHKPAVVSTPPRRVSLKVIPMDRD